MAKIKKATFDCPMCGQTVEMTTVAEPVVLSPNVRRLGSVDRHRTAEGSPR